MLKTITKSSFITAVFFGILCSASSQVVLAGENSDFSIDGYIRTTYSNVSESMTTKEWDSATDTSVKKTEKTTSKWNDSYRGRINFRFKKFFGDHFVKTKIRIRANEGDLSLQKAYLKYGEKKSWELKAGKFTALDMWNWGKDDFVTMAPDGVYFYYGAFEWDKTDTGQIAVNIMSIDKLELQLSTLVGSDDTYTYEGSFRPAAYYMLSDKIGFGMSYEIVNGETGQTEEATESGVTTKTVAYENSTAYTGWMLNANIHGVGISYGSKDADIESFALDGSDKLKDKTNTVTQTLALTYGIDVWGGNLGFIYYGTVQTKETDQQTSATDDPAGKTEIESTHIQTSVAYSYPLMPSLKMTVGIGTASASNKTKFTPSGSTKYTSQEVSSTALNAGARLKYSF